MILRSVERKKEREGGGWLDVVMRIENELIFAKMAPSPNISQHCNFYCSNRHHRVIYIIGVFCQSIVSKGEQRRQQFVAVIDSAPTSLCEINIIPSTNCIIFHAVFKNLAAATRHSVATERLSEGS